ncbi:hypothetical protein ACLOJK_040206 [Asimina triloba]
MESKKDGSSSEPILRDNQLFKSISTREPSFREFHFSPPRSSSSAIPSFFSSNSSHRCISSLIIKDGRILSIAALGRCVYTVSDANVVRVWKLPQFTECQRLRSNAGRAVSALAVSESRIFAAYDDGKIRVWRRLWGGDASVPQHVRESTMPRLADSIRNYMAGKDRKSLNVAVCSVRAFEASSSTIFTMEFNASYMNEMGQPAHKVATNQVGGRYKILGLQRYLSRVSLNGRGATLACSAASVVAQLKRSMGPTWAIRIYPPGGCPQHGRRCPTAGNIRCKGSHALETHGISRGWFRRATLRSLSQTKQLGRISSLALNVADDLLYSASLDGRVKVWRISSLKCIETIQAHGQQPVNAVSVGEDGMLYTASDDASIRVWRSNLGSCDKQHRLATTLPTRSSPVKALALTSDSAFLYGGCSDGYVHCWLRGWLSGHFQYSGPLQGHSHAVTSLAAVACYVASGSADSTCRVWMRQRDGQHVCLAVLDGHMAPIRCVAAFLSSVAGADEDGCMVCTGSVDGMLKLWHVESPGPGALIMMGVGPKEIEWKDGPSMWVLCCLVFCWSGM